MPLANALLTRDQLDVAQPEYPLDLVVCPACSLVQITETVPPEELFREYLYFSSYSDSFVSHARELAHRLIRERSLGAGSLVVEVGSNDGYLLQHYRERGVPVLGIEPAANVAEVARREQGIPTIGEFFGPALADSLVQDGRSADVVHINNVLAHVSDLAGVVAGLARILKDTGVVSIEVPYLGDMIERCEFDTIYHEHLCYFSLTALSRLFCEHGLDVCDVERLDVHGGSLRVFASRRGAMPVAGAVDALIAEEAAWGVFGDGVYRAFAARVLDVRAQLRELFANIRTRGGTIAGYGAAAKGTVLLNYLKPEPGTIAYVVDRSPHKQNRFVPGVRLPIHAPSRLLEDRPSHLLLLAWNLAGEIAAQQAEYTRGGGRFIVPIPVPAIL